MDSSRCDQDLQDRKVAEEEIHGRLQTFISTDSDDDDSVSHYCH